MKVKLRLCQCLALLFLLLPFSMAGAGLTNVVINVRTLDLGSYDIHGDHDTLDQHCTAGKTDYDNGRYPWRHWIAFHIPEFPGTLTGAVFRAEGSYTAYITAETPPQRYELRALSTPVDTLRNGGLGLTNIFDDLADGAIYASGPQFPGLVPLAPVFSNNFVSAVNAARGSDFALGGSIPGLNLASPAEERVSILTSGGYIELQLQLSAPPEPTIYSEPFAHAIDYDEAQVLVGVCGVPPFTYRWYANGALQSQTGPIFNIANFSAYSSSLFVTVSNAFGVATSSVVQIQRGPEQVALNFSSRTVRVDDRVEFSLRGWYLTPYNATWYKDGISLGTLGALWTLPPARTNDSGNYHAVVSGTFGSITTAVARLEVVETAPLIQHHPVSRSAGAGSTPVLDGTVVGGPRPAVQWFRDGAPLAGKTNQAFGFPSIQLGDAGDFYFVASNLLGVVTSKVAAIMVYTTPPVFTSHPTNVTVPYGGAEGFRATAHGHPAPILRWFHNGTPLPQGAGTNFGGLQLNGVTTANAGSYYCVASNLSGMTTSQIANLTVFSTAPNFLLQPANQTAYYAGNARFDASASGVPTPFHRWYRNDVLLEAAFSRPTLNLSYVTPADLGSYYCVASNVAGMATSHVATLTILSVPPQLSGPADRSAEVGVAFSWTVTLSNPPAFVSLISEATGLVVQSNMAYSAPAQFNFSNPQISQSGRYFVVASNAFGVSTSRVATLTIYGLPPSVNLYRVNSAGSATEAGPVLEGSAVNFSAAAQGSLPRTLSLYRDGVLIPMAFPIRWVLSSVTPAEAGLYTAVASNAFGIATSAVELVVYRAGPLDRWTLRNPLPQGRDLQAIAWGQEKFVAVGGSGALVTSTNGTNWTARSTETTHAWLDVAYGNGRFVAVAYNGFALTSTNGERWDLTLVQSNLVLHSLTFGNGRFLAAGYVFPFAQPAAVQSTNGVDWSTVTVEPPCCYPNYLVESAFGAGRFLVANYHGSIASSEDLVSWTYTPGQIIPYPVGASFVNGSFIVLGQDGDFNTSADGITWGANTVNPIHSKNLNAATYGAGRYVIVGGKGRIITSLGNLSSWTAAISPTEDRLEDVIFTNNLFVAVGESGTILTSNDGLSWSNQTRGASQDLDGLAVANGLAVAVGKGGAILTSTDGAAWNYTQSPGGADLHGVAYGNGQWVAVGDSPNIFISSNGLQWTAHSPGFAFSYLKSVLYANNLWVAVGTNGQIITSSDALDWTARTSPTLNDLNDITYGNGTFVVVGDNNFQPDTTILTSPDGVTWVDRSISVGKNARSVGFANGLQVIALNDGGILYGNDAAASSWNLAASGINYDGANLRGVTWSNSLWVVVGNNGIILTSTNAQTWRQRRAPTFENLHAVRFINNTFIAIGNQGTILQSAPLVPEVSLAREGNQLRLIFSSPYEGIFKLQQTTNFIWSDLVNITNAAGTAEYVVPLPPGSDQRFFRVVAP
jgi:hypothetical protein